ncbi:MAG: acyltransferase [Novosphingobium sp.]
MPGPVPRASQRGADRLPQAAARLDWLDAAKGIGIVLVVLGHAMGGLMDVPGAASNAAMQALFFVVYTFHMPLFFFLAAVLVPRRLEKSPQQFARSLGTRVIYPYLLWSVIQFSVIFAAGSLVNSPVESYWPTILALPWQPVAQFWFLYVLALLQLASLALPALAPRGWPWLLLAGAVGLRIAAIIEPRSGVFDQAMLFSMYYALGLICGTARIERLRQTSPAIIVLSAVAFVAVLALTVRWSLLPLLHVVPDPSSPKLAWAAGQPIAMPAAFLGVFLCLVLGLRLRGRAARLMVHLGQASMAIYLTHVIVLSGCRIGLIKLAGLSPSIILALVLTLLGIAGGVIARQVSEKLRISRWTGLA